MLVTLGGKGVKMFAHVKLKYCHCCQLALINN